MPLAKPPPNWLRPDHYQALIDALEAARRAVCRYGGPTCDCKFGLLPYTFAGSRTIECTHRSCEHTGCPEIRQLMAQAKNAQRNAWARRSDEHTRTSHGWLCCLHHSALTPDGSNMNLMHDGNPAGAACGGVGHCSTCTPEADRIHGLLPPAESDPDDYDKPGGGTVRDADAEADPCVDICHPSYGACCGGKRAGGS